MNGWFEWFEWFEWAVFKIVFSFSCFFSLIWYKVVILPFLKNLNKKPGHSVTQPLKPAIHGDYKKNESLHSTS